MLHGLGTEGLRWYSEIHAFFHASEKMFPVKAKINKKSLRLILDITNILQIPACYIQASFQMHSGTVWWPSRRLWLCVCVLYFLTVLTVIYQRFSTLSRVDHYLKRMKYFTHTKINIFGCVIGKSKYKHRNNNVTFRWLCSLARVKPCLKY